MTPCAVDLDAVLAIPSVGPDEVLVIPFAAAQVEAPATPFAVVQAEVLATE